MRDANQQHQQELYNEKLSHKKIEVGKHVKETVSSRNKKKAKKIKKKNSNTNVISRIRNGNNTDFEREFELGKNEKCFQLNLSLITC